MAIDSKAATWRPNWGVTPGELLLEALEERGMSQAELARRMSRPVKTINEIVKAKAALTAETAVQLEMVLDIPASFWTRAEANYREFLAREEFEHGLERDATWVQQFPIRDILRRTRARVNAAPTEQVESVLRFFGVSSRVAWERQWASTAASFSRSTAFGVSPGAVAAWLRIGEVEASKIDCEPFDATKLEEALPDIRAMTVKKPIAFLSELKRLLASCGVALVLTPELTGTHIRGATRWITPDKVLVQVSLRHRTDDHFWLALFHELGHVLRGTKRRPYLDLLEQDPRVDDDEIEANQFARDQLISEADYDRIIGEPDLTAENIEEAARAIGVAPGIIVGRLQRDDRLPHSSMNYLKQQFHWLTESRR